VALRDTDGDGRADSTAYFGERGGTGVAVAPGWLYVDQGPELVRYPLPAGSLRPNGAPQTVVTGLPMGGHSAHNFVLDGRGGLFVNVGSRTNSCQQNDRGTGSPGVDPCTELDTRAGVWRFAADRPGQTFAPAARYATGIRNAMGLAVEPRSGQLYTTQHGRDQLLQNWGTRFTAAQSAELPAEEFMQVNQGDDFGWPYCYYDHQPSAQRLVLAPEYGGDGRAVGRCASKKAPVAAFPGHWAPMASLFYTGSAFPARYRDGVFISFHGSWNRAPLPQAGYRVVFQPLQGGRASGRYETFADGFAGETATPSAARHRPAGLAQAPDGSVYVTDDARGRVWKIVYTGAR
jgi:glucose/arabinose dehydrogenase